MAMTAQVLPMMDRIFMVPFFPCPRVGAVALVRKKAPRTHKAPVPRHAGRLAFSGEQPLRARRWLRGGQSGLVHRGNEIDAWSANDAQNGRLDECSDEGEHS